MSALLITTGHNASVIEVNSDNHRISWGYEAERFTGVKSDSRFPSMITDKARKPDEVYVTHWSPDGLLESVNHKYWQPEVFHGIPVRSLSPAFTHHDSHIYAGMWFAGPEYFNDGPVLGVVCDGFGNLGEHLSIYEITNHRTVKLLRRFRGYDTSLGLLYQYTTAFLGMKMHEDEYKLLGYEAHITSVLSAAERQKLDNDITSVAAKWYELMDKVKLGDTYDPVFNVDALPAVKEKIFSMLAKVCDKYDVKDSSSHNGRVVIAYYVQSLLEEVMHIVLRPYETKYSKVLLSGGVFYNVKLNWNFISSEFDKVCICPLAGDQGNALGLYYKCQPEFEFDGSLCIGHRPNIRASNVPGLVFCSEHNFPDVAIQVIEKFGFVNLVRGAMEFGPRALCNTSTLALPTAANVEAINYANGRNTVMPMAPVVTRKLFDEIFVDGCKLHRSEKYMIAALEYKSGAVMDYNLGAAHYYPLQDVYTGRPQVNDDPAMIRVLDAFDGMLINTSFNVHGNPIVFNMNQVIHNHLMQRAKDERFMTIYVAE